MKQLGWKPDVPDARDHRYAAPRAVLRALPKSVDLRGSALKVIDQGSLGSCVGCAVRSAFGMVAKQQGQSFDPSPLFLYYNARLLDGAQDWDAGAYIRDGIKGVNQYGACASKTWPYRTTRFADKPPAKAYNEALDHQTLAYSRVDNTRIEQIKARLAQRFPVVFGFGVYESFDSIGSRGLMPMPKSSEYLLGGHAVVAVGYDDATKLIIVQNSWGRGWGDKGFFYMPYDFIASTEYADDFWTVEIVE